MKMNLFSEMGLCTLHNRVFPGLYIKHSTVFWVTLIYEGLRVKKDTVIIKKNGFYKNT